MFNKKNRKFFCTTNKYQERIVLLAFLPSLLIFLAFSGIFFLMASETMAVFFHGQSSSLENFVSQWSSWIVAVLCVVFVLALVFAFVFSHNLVGAFSRIIAELDEIIAGRSQKPITARPADELANELLKRVNVLIQHYIEHKKTP